MTTEMRLFALRWNARSMWLATTEQEFNHYAKWVQVYLSQLGYDQ